VTVTSLTRLAIMGFEFLRHESWS